ncbi:MAG: hypothetical protein VYA32_08110, partial [Planctomycetota bacterium]|nr:hypothetical protein [Planctomycetota bacterium]
GWLSLFRRWCVSWAERDSEQKRRGLGSVGLEIDVRKDPAEKQNLYQARPEVARGLEQKHRKWQQSVLESLSGNDYRSDRSGGGS